MIRAVAKGAVQYVFGRLPGGCRLYRGITRRRLGTQGAQVDKLARVWPRYVRAWTTSGGLVLKDSRVWIHEGGWTPFPFLMAYMATGRGPTVTNVDSEMLDRYAAHAIEVAQELDSPWFLEEPSSRVHSWKRSMRIDEIVEAVGGILHENVDPSVIPIEDASIDLLHSGGALEHYRPDCLKAFAHESKRVLRHGGIASHVIDHRDHLFYFDKQLPFLWHLSLSDTAYEALFGHSLAYHNRLLPSQAIRLFEEAGFELITVSRLILPSHRRVESDEDVMEGLPGIARDRLALRYRSASDIDLRTAAAHYLFRRV